MTLISSSSSSPADHSHIWKPLSSPETAASSSRAKQEEPAVIFYVDVHRSSTQPRTTFCLADVVRKYTGARLQQQQADGGKGGSVLQVELTQLYDILGMLRSLQYDVQLYNNNASSFVAVANTTTTTNAAAHARYCRYRLERQAVACNVRLLAPPPTMIATTTTAAAAAATQPVVVVVVVEGLDALVRYVEDAFRDRIAQARQPLEEHGLLEFDSLCEYCTPGTVLVDSGLLTGLAASPTCVRVRASRFRRSKTAMGNVVSVMEAAVEFVVAMGGSDDSDYAVIEAQWSVSEFEGARSIRDDGGNVDGSFLLRPTAAILEELAQRGRAYESFCFPTRGEDHNDKSRSGSGILVDYQAGTFWPCHHGGGTSSNKSVSSSSPAGTRPSRSGGRMMVDPLEAWSRGVHPCKPPADGAASDAVLETLQSFARYRRRRNQRKKKDGESTTTAAPVTTDSSDGPDDILLLQGPLPDTLVHFTWPVVCGFSLQARVWGLALVEGLSKVQFETAAFDALVLPPTRKRLLRALITSHGPQLQQQQQPHAASADVLPGKGEGLIILLYGPPGVGKTLTAEAVSEVLHRPLYRVSMGELGTTPESLEERLQEIFDLCLPWKALVLIDEAEMLLETRAKSSDLIRNAMVCVMLRLLEYYPGILFLTTNSGVDQLDPAVASRITCALHYNSLDLDGRKEIWRASLARVVGPSATAPPTITESDLTFLATEYESANGRQIKNAVQLASIVCRHEQLALTLESLRETLEMTATLTP